jgi:hypothetical protein
MPKPRQKINPYQNNWKDFVWRSQGSASLHFVSTITCRYRYMRFPDGRIFPSSGDMQTQMRVGSTDYSVLLAWDCQNEKRSDMVNETPQASKVPHGSCHGVTTTKDLPCPVATDQKIIGMPETRNQKKTDLSE